MDPVTQSSIPRQSRQFFFWEGKASHAQGHAETNFDEPRVTRWGKPPSGVTCSVSQSSPRPSRVMHYGLKVRMVSPQGDKHKAEEGKIRICRARTRLFTERDRGLMLPGKCMSWFTCHTVTVCEVAEPGRAFTTRALLGSGAPASRLLTHVSQWYVCCPHVTHMM
jgi:hypothetical protein